jgi:hypothetical protein
MLNQVQSANGLLKAAIAGIAELIAMFSSGFRPLAHAQRPR